LCADFWRRKGENHHDERFLSHLPAEELLQDAVLPPVIEHHCVELSESDGIVVIHLNW
jgi:NAD(P)H dehydrogenase (quinone)